MLPGADIACPYCGEAITVVVDASAGSQQYVEDCQVCCRPMLLQVQVDAEGLAEVLALRDDDA